MNNLVGVLLANVSLVILIAALWWVARRPARPSRGVMPPEEQLPSDQSYPEKPALVVHGGDNQLSRFPRSRLFYLALVVVSGLTFWFTWQSLQSR